MLKNLMTALNKKSSYQTCLRAGTIQTAVLAMALALFPVAASAIVADEADVSISLTASTLTGNAGDSITYTIVVTQLEADELTDMVVTDSLPANVEFVSSNSTNGACRTGAGTVVCNIGLTLGSPTTITIVVTPLSSGQYTNLANLTGVDTGDPNPINVTTGTNATATNATATATNATGTNATAINLTAQNIIFVTIRDFSTTSLGLNGFFYRANDTLNVNGKLTLFGIEGMAVDVWLIISDPQGKLSYLTADGGVSPIAAPMVSKWIAKDWPVGGDEGLVYNFTFTGNELSGTYTIYAYLTKAGTLTRVSNQTSGSFIYMP